MRPAAKLHTFSRRSKDSEKGGASPCVMAVIPVSSLSQDDSASPVPRLWEGCRFPE